MMPCRTTKPCSFSFLHRSMSRTSKERSCVYAASLFGYLCGFLLRLFERVDFAELERDQDCSCDEGGKVRDRTGEQDAVQAQEQRQQEHGGNEEDDLSSQRQHRAPDGLADGREEVGRNELHAVDQHHKEENAHKVHGELVIERVTRTKQ